MTTVTVPARDVCAALECDRITRMSPTEFKAHMEAKYFKPWSEEPGKEVAKTTKAKRK